MPEPFLGILQVNTTFHRPIGDVGNPQTWNIPIKIRIVTEANTDDVVKTSKNYHQDFINAWVNAALELVSEGAVAIITSCGFLATIHPILQAQIPVPVGTSSLLQIPLAQTVIPKHKKIGVITFDIDSLGEEHFRAVGVEYEVPTVGVKRNGRFQRILREGEPYDYEAIEIEILQAIDELLEKHDDIGGIVLECTNIPPFKSAIYKKTKLPVWDIITLGNYLYQVAFPSEYDH